MKRILSLFLVLAVLCTCMISVSAANPAVSVSSSKSAVNTGDTITVSVKLASGSNLGAIDLTVKYNTSEFQYVSGSVRAGGRFTMENTVDNSAGSIRYLGVTDGVVTSGGTLVSFKLKVLQYGGAISVSVGEAIDGNDADITSSVKTSGATLKCAHGNAQWKVTKEATCTAKGVETGTCPCGNISTRDIPMKDHTVSKYTVEKEPTCTEKGTKKAVCTVCNKEYTEEIKAAGHTYGKWIVEKEATETEKGLKVAECTVCGDKKEQTIPVIGTEETESSTEETTESTTAKEESTEPSTEEPTTKEPADNTPNGNMESSVISKVVVTTILSTLAVEAVIAGIVIFILKQRKKEKDSKN